MSPHENVDKGSSGEHFRLVEQVEREEVEITVAQLTQQILHGIYRGRNGPQAETLGKTELLQQHVRLASEFQLDHAECQDYFHQLLPYDN